MTEVPPEAELYLRYRRQRNLRRLLIALPILAVFGFFAYQLLPDLLNKKESNLDDEIAAALAEPNPDEPEPTRARKLKDPDEPPGPLELRAPPENALEVTEATRRRMEKIQAARLFDNDYHRVGPDGRIEGDLDIPEGDPRLATHFQTELKISRERQDAVGAAIDTLVERWNATAASDTDALRELVYEPDAALPRMRIHWSREGESKIKLGKLLSRSFFAIRGVEYVIESRNQNGNTLYAGWRNVGGGQFRLDWESMIAYSDMGWEEFIAKKPTAPTLFRCFAAKHDYYNHEFLDRERYACFVLTNRETFQQIYAFAERGSKAYRDMTSILSARPTAPMILEVGFNFGTAERNKNCVRLDRLIQETWIYHPEDTKPPEA